MPVKITFHNMPHSDPLEQHAKDKLHKVLEFVNNSDGSNPARIELWLKANKQHPHHGVDLHLKSPHHDLHAHDEGADMYVVLDNAIDKILTLLRKDKDKHLDKRHKPETEKKNFIK